ncbi:MAG TPA: asparagine synthase (glutamine-hydrolyzing) [Pyrinomonadaceae bacterium]|nr:asparagine synthase (glutamine-hydrolyzing) [Pyrinomonadaceae bacterium]
MCGIAGTVRIGDLALVERMTNLISYRGPDDVGLYEDGDVRLGHRRLSILDLSPAGHQPMLSDDGELAITFNGEIYNFLTLREELQKKGHQFHTETDTEVMLNAYREFGIDFLTHLEGMFAFALWDRKRRQLLLARDRTGIKPLFYYHQGDGLAFASELKPILLVPGFERRVNRRALRSAIRYASNIEDESMMASVFKLPPAHWMIWRDGVCTKGSYWNHPVAAPEQWDEQTLANELRQTLTDVVQSHMISDAPLGAALSGGLDSSGIVALMSQGHNASVDTFTVGHGTDDPDLIKARLVADHCRTNHHEILISAENVLDLLPAVIWHLEEPLGQMESLQMYINYREAAKFVKVLLIGEGADECFAGYARYKLLHSSIPLPNKVRKDLYERVYMYADQAPNTFPARAVARTLWGHLPGSPLPDPKPLAPLPFAGVNGKHILEQALIHDQSTYLHHLSLKRADAVGMAHSVELRVPFLDRKIVELAARIPASLMMRRGMEKYILRRALEPLLPRSISWRRKRGFQMRLNLGLVDTLNYLCDKLLNAEAVKARGFFDPELVNTLRYRRPGRFATPMAQKVWSYRVWSMILCELWARTFLDGDVSNGPAKTVDDLL